VIILEGYVRGRCTGVARPRGWCSRIPSQERRKKNLAESIRFVHACHKRIAPEVATELAEHAGDEALSPRELEVLTLVSSGNATKMIAAELCITEETVKGTSRTSSPS
jgi:DNA-binding NarL/FixJ family response regulator